uniref:Uncharacterized protein n=1 Tax=Romanomermis culicivorax TaxID=13658 RepID=A0A915IAC6_ROMCU
MNVVKSKNSLLFQQCDLCQKNKAARQKTTAALRPITITGPFHWIGLIKIAVTFLIQAAVSQLDGMTPPNTKI